MEQEKKAVALNPNTYVHLTDHLAPLCVALNIPFLLTDEKHAMEAKEFYPDLQVLFVNWLEVTPDYLVKNFDLFYQSEPWHRHDFYNKMLSLEKSHQKIIRNVHCPHGFSDKVWWFEKNVWEDILLMYGDNMFNLFKQSQLSEHLNITVRVGNYRYLYYQKYQNFYDKLIRNLVGEKLDLNRSTILYAPTHNNTGKSSSFFDCISIFENLPDDYNLIVKIHPAAEITDGYRLYALIKRYEKQKNVLFIRDFPLVYPLLALSDIYVGDISSIGYDFLVFNRPMFFFNHLNNDLRHDRHFFLCRCGFEIKAHEFTHFFKILEASLPYDREKYSNIRKEVYDYTFGEEVSFEKLREEMRKAYFLPKKWN